jgi:hypothetical protein
MVEFMIQLKVKAKSRNCLMEVDHPLPESSDPKVLQKRASVVHLKDSGALITDISFDGTYVWGTIEVHSGNHTKGGLVRDLINDKIGFGFSLRALGEVEPRNGVLYVNNPKAITYDIVSSPSDYHAHQMEVVNESTDINNFVSKYLTESINSVPTKFDDSTLVCTNEGCVRKSEDDLLQYIIESNVNKPELNKFKIVL